MVEQTVEFSVISGAMMSMLHHCNVCCCSFLEIVQIFQNQELKLVIHVQSYIIEVASFFIATVERLLKCSGSLKVYSAYLTYLETSWADPCP